MPPSNLSIWEEIHQTLHTYLLAIDTKDFDLLTSIFITSPTPNYTGIAAIQTGLAGSVAKSIPSTYLARQRLASTTARAQTPRPISRRACLERAHMRGKCCILYGFYADALGLVKGKGWRIAKRTLVFQGPGMTGNQSIIAQ